MGNFVMYEISMISERQTRRMYFYRDLQFIHSSSVRLTHWGQVAHKGVGKPTVIGSDNGLSPGRRQAIIWANDGILLIGHLGTNFIETFKI